VWAHSRRQGLIPWSRTLAYTTNVSKDLSHAAGHSFSHPYLLSTMFHESPGNGRAVLPADRNGTMTLLDESGQAPDRESDQYSKVSVPSGSSCPRCSGLLIHDYDAAALGREDKGTPVMVRRCVNCGNCIDFAILANRGKCPQPPPPRTRRARPPTGIPRARQRQTGRTGKAG
jgi:Zn ribbon nucleic-acid-binding protein